MTSVARRLYEDALSLPVDDRADLAARLIESLETPADQGVESAWREEVGRRVAAIDAGEVEMVPWEEAEAMIFGDVDASGGRS